MAYSESGSSPWWGGNLQKLYGEYGLTPPGSAPAATPGVTPGATPASTTPVLPDYSQISNIIAQINAQNQQAQQASNAGRIPFAPQLEQQSSQFISNLYNDANRAPGEMFANISTNAAEAAVAGGYAGSPFAGVSGLRLNEEERLRRGGLAQGYTSAALARNPGFTPADPQSLVQMLSQQMYGAGQNQMERDLRERIANAQMANAALQNRRNINAYNNRSYGPSLPTDYGRPGMGTIAAAGSQTNIPEDPNRFGPYQLPKVSPNIGGLENWMDLNRWQQDDYNRLLSQNPYFGMPDYMNPYSGDEMGPGTPGWNAAGAVADAEIPYDPNSNVF